MTGEIIYGGWVTDNHDRKTLNMILDIFLDPDVVESDDYKYSDSGIYYAKDCKNIAEYVEYINSLPDIDPPELFGMNENADNAVQLTESISLIETVLSLQPWVGGGVKGAKNPDIIVDEICSKIEENMPEMLTDNGSAWELWKTDKQGLMASLSTYLS